MTRRITLLGVGCDEHSSFLRGPAQAPAAIRTALESDSSNAYSETGLNILQSEHLNDRGDLDFTNPETDYHGISEHISNIVLRGERPLSLGGDHAVTFPIVRGLAEHHTSFSILHFDAHGDLYHEFEGNPYSHACPFARIMELGVVERLIQVGIRSLNDHQREQIEKFGVECHEMIDFKAHEFQLDISGPVYISIDIDALDPAYAPGVSHLEPGGLSTRQLLTILHQLRHLDVQIIGADVVEYNPTQDVNQMTAMVAAKLVKELAGLMLLCSD